MFDIHRDPATDREATLERLRDEVASLSMNLETLADRPEAHIAKARFHADDRVELLAHFSYESVEPAA